MYSNPSRFAPKVRKTGGEAYPQAPTMDQFFSYGAPTPQVPFVFQDGGDTMSFSDPKPNRVGGFLDKIKRLGYEAIQKEMADEGMMMDDAYYQASDEMDLAAMQWGGGWTGGYETNFDAANQWGDLADQDTDMMGVFSDFAGAAKDFAGNPDEYYIKKMKYNYKPTAQYGMELQEFQGDVGESQVNRDAALAQAEYFRGLPARGSGPVGNPFQMFNLPGAAPITRGTKQIVNGRRIDRNAPIAMPDYYVGENSYAGYVPQPKVAAVRTTGRPGDGSILYDPNKMQGPFNPNWRPFQPIGGTQTTTTKEEEKPPAPRATSKKTQTTTQPTTSTNPAAPGTPPATPETPSTGKPEEKPKDTQTPGAGTGPAQPTAPENKTTEEVKREAADLGMSPQQYMTFLTHADVKMGPLGRRLRKASFDFTTYGPGMNPITASANQQKPFFYDSATGKMEGAAPNGMRRDVPGENPRDRKDGFFKRLFNRPDEQERWNPEKGPKLEGRESLIGKSQFNPEGYSDKNYMSDIRNQRATDRLTRLGERIDRNIQRERSLDDFYDANISNRMQRLRNRDERRYNRIADRFGREDYQDPRFRDYAYGGDMGYFQGDQGSSEVFDEGMFENYTGESFGDSAGLNYDMTGTAKDPNEMGLVGKGKLDVKFGKKNNPYTKQFIGAGLDLLSAGITNREARKNEKMFRSKMGADQVFTPMQDMSRGDYTANEGYFRPDQQVPVQFSGYNFESPYARYGGSYQKGGEYYLSDEEIQEIINMGGEVEFLD